VGDTIRKLVIALGVKVDDKKLEGFTKRLGISKERMGQLKAAGRGLAKGLAVVGAAAGAAAFGLFKLVGSIAETGDTFAKEGKKIGISAQTLQEWSFAAERSGANAEQLIKAVTKMAKQMNDARIKGTGPLVDQLDDLGISIEEFQGLNTEEAFAKFADVIASIDSPVRRAAFAQDVFGRSGRDLIPLLAEGADGIEALREEAKRLGLTMSDETAAASEQFQDSMLDLKSVVNGLKFAVGAELIPVVRNWIERAKDWILANRELIAGKVTAFVQGMIKAIRELLPLASKIIGWLGEFVKALGGADDALIAVVSTLGGLKIATAAAAAGLGPGGILVGALIALSPFLAKFADQLVDIIAQMNEIGARRDEITGKRGQVAATPAERAKIQDALTEQQLAERNLAAIEARSFGPGGVGEIVPARERLKRAREAVKNQRTIIEANVKRREAEARKLTTTGPTLEQAGLTAEQAAARTRRRFEIKPATAFGAPVTGKPKEEEELPTLENLLGLRGRGAMESALKTERERAPVSIQTTNYNFEIDAPVTIEGADAGTAEDVYRRLEDWWAEQTTEAAANLAAATVR
jgi:hypothetical protein